MNQLGELWRLEARKVDGVVLLFVIPALLVFTQSGFLRNQQQSMRAKFERLFY